MAERIETVTADIRVADISLRRLDLTLRTADAIHIALTGRSNASLVTFDAKMAASAAALKVNLVKA